MNSSKKRINFPILTEEERLSCEGQITTDECVKALDTFENGKTPGNDGIPVEFYKTFWGSVGELMTEVFNYSIMLRLDQAGNLTYFYLKVKHLSILPET